MTIEGEIALSEAAFDRIRQRLHASTGIALSGAKRTLVVSRLGKIVRALGLSSFEAYLDRLDVASAADQEAFVNALTTNLTRFYREEHHFTHLRQHIAAVMQGRHRSGPDGRARLRVWSAGCSTGQEPYTMGLDLMAALPELRHWDFLILATDIDTKVLGQAAGGLYPESEIAELPAERARLFEPTGAGMVRIPAAVRERVAFKPLNLMANWPMTGQFEAIFCRNVAIYFDKATQARLFERLGQMLVPGGFLYIGHSENLGAGAHGFKLVGKTIYQNAGNGAVRAA